MDWIRTGAGRYRAVDAAEFAGRNPLGGKAAGYCWWAVVDTRGRAVGWLIPGATAQALHGRDGEVSCYLGTALGDPDPIRLEHLGVDAYGARGGVLTVAEALETRHAGLLTTQGRAAARRWLRVIRDP